MKIGLITTCYPSSEDDFLCRYLHRLMLEICKRGHEVHVIAPYVGTKTKYTLEGISVERFHYFYPKRCQRLAGGKGMDENVKSGRFVKVQAVPYVLVSIFKTLKDFRHMDLIHVSWLIPNAFGAYLAKKIFNIPYLNTIHGEEAYLSKKYGIMSFFKFLVNNSNKCVVVSKGTRDYCIKNGMDQNKFSIIQWGIDTQKLYPKKSFEKDETIYILSIGTLIQRKGFEYLIKAMPSLISQFKNIKLRIAGDGPDRKDLEYLIRSLGLENKVELLGRVKNEELFHLYNSSHIFILPSIIDDDGNTEGLGIVFLEAMACKLPVIGTNVGGIPDIVKDKENGILIPEKDSKKIMEALIYLIENEEIRNNLALNGYNLIQNEYSWDIIANSYLNLYNEIIKQD